MKELIYEEVKNMFSVLLLVHGKAVVPDQIGPISKPVSLPEKTAGRLPHHAVKVIKWYMPRVVKASNSYCYYWKESKNKKFSKLSRVERHIEYWELRLKDKILSVLFFLLTCSIST